MVETIAPVVHGGRRSRWWASVALHAAGTTLAAGVFGAVLGAVGGLLGAPWGVAGLVAVALVGALYAARELLGLRVPIPDRRRQVPEWWRTFFPAPVAAFMYGLGLGVGFLTYLRHGTLVVVAALAVVGGDPLLGAALMAPFGLARGVSVIVARRATSGTAIAAAVDRLERLAQTRLPSVANGIAVMSMAAAAFAAAAGEAPGPATSGIGAWLLAAVFGWAALSKVLLREAWTGALAAYGLGPLERPAAIGVPLLELGIPGLVVAGFPRLAALGALVLLAAFSAAILRARARVGDRLPCGCFGRAARRDVRLALFRNALLGALALLVVAAPSRAPAFGWPSAGELVPAVMVAAAAVLAGVMLRELARMSERRAG